MLSVQNLRVASQSAAQDGLAREVVHGCSSTAPRKRTKVWLIFHQCALTRGRLHADQRRKESARAPNVSLRCSTEEEVKMEDQTAGVAPSGTFAAAL